MDKSYARLKQEVRQGKHQQNYYKFIAWHLTTNLINHENHLTLASLDRVEFSTPRGDSVGGLIHKPQGLIFLYYSYTKEWYVVRQNANTLGKDKQDKPSMLKQNQIALGYNIRKIIGYIYIYSIWPSFCVSFWVNIEVPYCMLSYKHLPKYYTKWQWQMESHKSLKNWKNNV